MAVEKNFPYKLSIGREHFRTPVKMSPQKTKPPSSGKENLNNLKKSFHNISRISQRLTLSGSSPAKNISPEIRTNNFPVFSFKGNISASAMDRLKKVVKNHLFGTTFSNTDKKMLKRDMALFAQLRMGALGKEFTGKELLHAIKNAAMAIWDLLEKENDKKEEEDITTELLGILMDLHSSYTFKHSNRVTDMTMDVASKIGLNSKKERENLRKAAFLKDIGQYGVDDLSLFPGQEGQKIKTYIEEIGQTLRECSHLHDIGKMKIPKSILDKKGPLTDEEYTIIKDHPLIGVEIVSLFPYLHGAIPGIRGHHERWDGKGYPDGLKGKKIPVEARIISIVDSFDAMTSKRPYRTPLSSDDAIKEIIRCGGTQFDPEFIGPFIYTLEQKGEIEPGAYDKKIQEMEDKYNSEERAENYED